MSGRCYSCNSILTESELKTQWIGTNEYTNLCSYCYEQTINLNQENTNGPLHTTHTMS